MICYREQRLHSGEGGHTIVSLKINIIYLTYVLVPFLNTLRNILSVFIKHPNGTSYVIKIMLEWVSALSTSYFSVVHYVNNLNNIETAVCLFLNFYLSVNLYCSCITFAGRLLDQMTVNMLSHISKDLDPRKKVFLYSAVSHTFCLLLFVFFIERHYMLSAT